MESGLGGGRGLCQSPSHMQPRGLWGCEAAPPRTGPETRHAHPMEEREPATTPPPAPQCQSDFVGGQGGGRYGDGVEIYVSGSLFWTLTPVTAISPPPPVTQPSGHDPRGWPWERPSGQTLPQPSSWRTLEPLAVLFWTGVEGCGTGSRLAQLCRSVSPFCLSLILATTLDTGEFQMTNFLRDLE